MQQIRDTLGEDAIIVTSRDEPGGVRVTAAVEQDSLSASPPVATQDEKAAAALLDEDTITEEVTDILMKHRVPAAVLDKIISGALTRGGKTIGETLSGALEESFDFADLPLRQKAPMVLVGPPGAGKTLTAAKLAARSVMDGIAPVVISTDTIRAGGTDQLQAFLNILELDLYVAEDFKYLQKILQKEKGTSPVIIDTGGLNPFDPQEMKDLAKLLSVEATDPVLVLPAGMDAEESAEMAMTFSVLGVKKLLPTRLDFARRLGGILNAADRANLTFTIGSHTPQVADGFISLTPEKLAHLLIPGSSGKR